MKLNNCTVTPSEKTNLDPRTIPCTYATNTSSSYFFSTFSGSSFGDVNFYFAWFHSLVTLYLREEPFGFGCSWVRTRHAGTTNMLSITPLPLGLNYAIEIMTITLEVKLTYGRLSFPPSNALTLK